jgi:hypothetical protein
MRKICVLLALSVAALVPALAGGQAVSMKMDNEFVQREFGREFTLIPEFGVMTGDLDGDGVEDAVIAARCRNPLIDAAQHNYMVLDPYMTFYGYGDPRVTLSFGDEDPGRRGLVVLIIHGAGPDAWRAAAPKAKYVIINLPYKELSVRKFNVGKNPKKMKQQLAIYAEESNEEKESSAVYFDGKTYKYSPMGASME